VKRLIAKELPKYRTSCKSRVLGISRSVLAYRHKIVPEDDVIAEALRSLAEKFPSEGFWKSYHRLKRAGYTSWNHKRVYRVYRSIGLSIRRKVKKRLPARVKEPLEVPEYLNDTWSVDFTHDRLENSRPFRSFNVMDDANRECLHVEVDHSLPSTRVVWVLNYLIHRRAKPRRIRMDNGPEFIAALTQQWCEGHG